MNLTSYHFFPTQISNASNIKITQVRFLKLKIIPEYRHPCKRLLNKAKFLTKTRKEKKKHKTNVLKMIYESFGKRQIARGIFQNSNLKQQTKPNPMPQSSIKIL